VIDPKINIRSKPTPSAQSESLIKGNAAIARADTEVQTRAYKPALTSSTSFAEDQMAMRNKTGTKPKPMKARSKKV
jgi:hypothetical protein